MDECPELGKVVLEGCAGEDETVLRGQSLKSCGNIGFFVLDLVAFIENDVAPDESAAEPLFLMLKDFVASDDQIIPSILHPFFPSIQSNHLPTLGDSLKSLPLL